MTRIERVAELIKKEISGIIREDVSDPRIGFVSITRVDVSSDLENAKVFISILGGENVKKESMHGLQSATNFIRGKLGNLLEMRLVPEIRFVRDDSLEKASQVLGIISKIGKGEHEENTSQHKKGRKKR
ncbi:ribosome-binding factor A [candidate division WOR-1 bacterium RIFCSPLOWO2_02_FULL_46_20]|uniref:Ribosome-binding factor A n=2 Tax=Saganbacteria TaxID=1703751 RepID=A0A1F4RDC1_UNCSA|nr:MAG: ribosome-binding factor A [candidate division WOR-1 bacterium RIFCSPHIGHO2_02_FULL_45_12]OGC06170.1 MAG: ribosome-binding factor A [candidate division WOR-1 bacterium RIFCSPLOWO2_02_FULL_46_20]OGC09407.1 MAG: ribosome-binding factor A [candidate division WOR-1 bacterium RIFCSPLOWO2_12_FULL_45_9]